MAKEKQEKTEKTEKSEKPRKGGSGSDKKESKGKKDDVSKFAVMPKGYVARLMRKYREEVVPALFKKFEYSSPMQVPRVEKVVVNMGVGEGSRNIKVLEEAIKELTLITGQKPKMTKATKSVAQFKLREGMPVGCCVTLRGARMYDFLDRLINVAIPRVRDFRGLPLNAFDGRGNHSMGVKEQLIFTELDYNQIETIRGMNITTVTTAKTDAECRELLTLLGMPFRKS
jgi:large subunit ribosomal protein L5